MKATAPSDEIRPCGYCGRDPAVYKTPKMTVIDCPRCKNRVFERSEYGEELAFDGAVALWNKAYGKGQ